MSRTVTIVCSCMMGPGTFEAKFIPISRMDIVDKIIVVRKERGPKINKVFYAFPPITMKHIIFKSIITPIFLTYQVIKHRPSFILAYHYVPHFYYAYMASLLTGVPYVLGQTGNDDQLLAMKPVKGWFLRHVISKAIRLNVPGERSLSFWLKMGFRHVSVLHSTIDTEYFIPMYEDKRFDFVYIGRLREYKGVHRIIHSIKTLSLRYPSVKMAIVGYGDMEENLKSLVAGLGIANNVEFMGFHKDTRQWLSLSRVFVMASDTEGLPCSLMEAMSCELLCIASNVGNISDILIDGETGYLFERNDQEKLNDLMLMAYEQEPEMSSIKTAAREIIVKEHSHYSAADKWRELIDIIEREK